VYYRSCGSTVKNDLLSNVRPADRELVFAGIGGVRLKSSTIGDIGPLIGIYLVPEAGVNVIALVHFPRHAKISSVPGRATEQLIP